jgi:hypothetical protein
MILLHKSCMLSGCEPTIKPSRLMLGEFSLPVKGLFEAQKLRRQKIHDAGKEQNTAKQACII